MSDHPKLDVASTRVRREWKHTAPLIGCRIDPTGRYVFASAMDNTVRRWDLESNTHAALGGHDSWLRAMGFSLDGNQFYTAAYDGKLCFWETESESPTPIREIGAHDGWIRWLAVHPRGHLLATGGNDNLVKVWSAENGELIHTLRDHDKHVYSLLFHPDGKSLISGDLRGVVHVWDVETGERVRTLDAQTLHIYHNTWKADYGGVRCLAASADGAQLVCGGLHKGTNPFAGVQEPLAMIFDWESGQLLRTHEATGITRGILWRVKFVSDDILLGASGGGTGGFLLFWKEEKTQVQKVKLPNTILDMDVHPNGIDVVTAHHDGRVRISRMARTA